MHRRATTHELLAQFATEIKADLVLISVAVPQQDPASWHLDISDTAVICVRDGTLLRVLTQGRGDGFDWIRCSGITFVSVYLTPNEIMMDFRGKFDALEDGILGKDGRFLVGEFNAWALEWGIPHSDSRGKRILEMMARTGLVVLNTGPASTFRHPGWEGSFP